MQRNLFPLSQLIAFIETPKVNQTWMKTISRSEEHSLELCKVPKVISDHVEVIFMHVSPLIRLDLYLIGISPGLIMY